MTEHASSATHHHEIERNAYNAAFHELGLRWHWDRETYRSLTRSIADAKARIRHYLETRQAHLLKAYDAEFLAGIIDEKRTVHRNRGTASKVPALRHFDWSQTLGAEIGA